MIQAKIEQILRTISPALGVMTVFLLSAFLVYNVYYKGTPSVDLAKISPAAGKDIIYDNGEACLVIYIDNGPAWSSIDAE